METEFSDSSASDTFCDQTLNFVSWLKKEKELCSKISKNNVIKFKQNESKLKEKIEENNLEIKKILENVTRNLNLFKCSIDKRHQYSTMNMVTTKEFTDFIEECEKNLTKLDNETKLLEKEQKTIEKNKFKISAHKTAIQYYETNFNLKAKLLISNEDHTVIETIFENKKQYPVKMVLDNSNNILSFEIRSLKSTNEHNQLTNWFAETKDPVNLMVKLRKYVMNLK